MEKKEQILEKEEAPVWLIKNIAEASKNARKLYLIYIGLLAFL